MSKNALSLASGLLLLSGAALAQTLPAPAVGTAMDVEGLVTVSQGASVGSVASNTPVMDGARFVTASTGSVTLKFKDGCEVKLKPNQSLEVDSSKPCAVRIAAVQTLSNQAGGALLAGGGGGAGLTAAGLFAAGVAVVNNAGGAAVVGAGGSTPVTPPAGGGGGNEGGVVTPPIVNPPASGQ